jgi:hypothetical protein
MRRTSIAFIAVIALACDKEKSGVEKRAEDMAKEKAAASAAAKASASVVDPKEAQYAAKRKALKERVEAHLKAMEKLYTKGAGDAETKAYKEFFADTKEGQKEAEDGAKEAITAATKTGMSIKKWEISDLSLGADYESGVSDIAVEELQAGGKMSRCVTYKLDWKEVGGTWRRMARRDFRIVACPQ